MRAYSQFEIKAVDDEQRVLEGIATSPRTDRIGDIVEPRGADYTLPLPFLWQHKQDAPIGHVTRADVADDGIRVRVQIAKTDEPGPLKTRLDDAWQSLKAGLVRGLSIGFTPIEATDIKGTWGQRFVKWAWLELSAVTIPANVDATISAIKSHDVDTYDDRAASGTGPTNPGVTGPVIHVRKTSTGTGPMKISEQVKQFEQTRAAKAARMAELMTKAGDAGETLDAAASEEYDTLDAEVVAIDQHLDRLRKQEQVNKAAATPVDGAATRTTRAGVGHVSVRPAVGKGIGFARYAMALLNCKGNRYEAAEYARQQWPDQPEVAELCKAAVAPGTTTDATWAGPLVPITPLVDEFIDLLRPTTLIGKITGLRRVPFNVSVPKITGPGSVSWVGQAKPKPVSALAFGTVTLPFAKAAGIVVLTKELVKLSTPSAQVLVRDTMVETMRLFLDAQFSDPAVAIAANVSPASITNGVAGIPASATTPSAARTDLAALVQTFVAANYDISQLTWAMTQGVAFALGMMLNPLGQPAFPGLTVDGGTLLGIPVVTSNVVGTQIILMHAPSILYADDGQTEIDVSEQASVQMDSAPMAVPDATVVMTSLWQNNLVGLRFDRFATWLKARADAVNRITGVAYVPSAAEAPPETP